MTLIFNFCQALACAEVKATLISPFVGRILDWFKAAEKKDFKPAEEPGVRSVAQIYNYYKKYGHQTIVMGASFRNPGEIVELAGCDRLTISPELLDTLTQSHEKLEKKLDAEEAKKMDIKKEPELTEKFYRWMMNEDAMATEKLADGIRRFGKDTDECEKLIQERMAALK
jgi:transaldolase